MAKNIEISTEFLGEEYTLRNALRDHLEKNRTALEHLRKMHGRNFVPNQHLYTAAIKNCLSLLKKLE